MKLFTTLFRIAGLPVAVALDVVTCLPDMASGNAFDRTEEQCEKIDAGISGAK